MSRFNYSCHKRIGAAICNIMCDLNQNGNHARRHRRYSVCIENQQSRQRVLIITAESDLALTTLSRNIMEGF